MERSGSVDWWNDGEEEGLKDLKCGWRGGREVGVEGRWGREGCEGEPGDVE